MPRRAETLWNEENGERARSAFKTLFAGKASKADVEIVLGVMQQECCANKTTFYPDDTTALKMAHAEGKRAVWLFIQDMIEMSETESRVIYSAALRALSGPQ